jgi:hypothetical protein
VSDNEPAVSKRAGSDMWMRDLVYVRVEQGPLAGFFVSEEALARKELADVRDERLREERRHIGLLLSVDPPLRDNGLVTAGWTIDSEGEDARDEETDDDAYSDSSEGNRLLRDRVTEELERQLALRGQ